MPTHDRWKQYRASSEHKRNLPSKAEEGTVDGNRNESENKGTLGHPLDKWHKLPDELVKLCKGVRRIKEGRMIDDVKGTKEIVTDDEFKKCMLT